MLSIKGARLQNKVKRKEFADFNKAEVFVEGIPSLQFIKNLVDDYEKNLFLFFDDATGAIREGERDDGSPGFLYSELTGLAIQDLLNLFAITGNRRYLSAAERAVQWLVDKAMVNGLFRTRFYFENDEDPSLRLYSFSGGNIFTFDNAICLQGIAKLFAVNRREDLRTIGNMVAEKLVSLVRYDGLVPAVCRLDGIELILDDHRWSQQSGCAHAKIAEALAEWMKISGDHFYEDTCHLICTYVLGCQREDGRFITDPLTGATHLHPHCYAAEGLLHAGEILGEPKYEEAALQATLWALQHSLQGKIPQILNNNCDSIRTYRIDAIAQVLSLAARLTSLGRLRSDLWNTLTELAETLLKSKDSEHGFFKYGQYEDGTVSSTLSYWTNAFAFRALVDYVAAWVARSSTCIILAGGCGNRAWPMAGQNIQKALVKGLLESGSMLETTVSRLLDSRCVQPNKITVITSLFNLDETKQQLSPLGVQSSRILAETYPHGPVAALKCAIPQIEHDNRQFLILSMADDLIEPNATFRDALLRGAIIAYYYSKTIVTLGIPTNKHCEHFGHSFYSYSLIPGVHRIKKFIEKPSEEEYSSIKQLPHAWESGCIISNTGNIIGSLFQKGVKKEDIARTILEPTALERAVSLYSPAISFVDLGALGPYIFDFFQNTNYDQSGNRCFSNDPGRIRIEDSERNFILSDRLAVKVVGLREYLIIDSSECNTALVMPLAECSHWYNFIIKFRERIGVQSYLEGGLSAASSQPMSLELESQGNCDILSHQGLVLVFRAANVTVKRDEIGLIITPCLS